MTGSIDNFVHIKETGVKRIPKAICRCHVSAGCPFRMPQPLHLANLSPASVVRVILSDVKELVVGCDVTPVNPELSIHL